MNSKKPNGWEGEPKRHRDAYYVGKRLPQAHTGTKNRFFMRFYKQPIEKVEKAVAEIKAIHPEITKTTIDPLKFSMNLFVPQSYLDNAYEVFFYFNTYEETVKARDDPRVGNIYKKYAVSGEIVKRNPTDHVWKHR
jgi:hypothetical protein